MQQVQATKMSKIRMIIGMMLSPGEIIKKSFGVLPLLFSIIVSGLAFGLFFFQTGLDLYKTGQQTMLFVATVSLAGTVFGATVVPFLACLVWVLAKAFGTKKTIKWTISVFCLSYSGALVYCMIGLVFSLFMKWNTSIAFGVTGVLWAIGPIISSVREMLEGKVLLSVLISALTGAVVLFCWSFLGQY